ncbi:hypothetical protein evm_011392 [Chilo suppressalis]|nr:hypothetical protein evm_011392 [Chilo suppressalis]
MAAGGRTPKQRKSDMSSGMAALRNVSNTPRRRRGSCKCLFGAPDRDETTRLMAEQYARDRNWFIRRFNFDIETERPYKVARLESPVKFWDEDKENSRSPVRSATDALACVGNTDLKMLGSPSRRSNGSAGSSPRTPRTPRTPRAARTPRTPRTPASRRQLQMTDYWTLRKNTESTSSDKEN